MYPSLTTFPGDLFADFDALQRGLDRLFGWNDGPSSIRAVARGSFPALNMGTNENGVEIYAFAPGLDPSRLELSVDKGLLTLSGVRPSDVEEGEKTIVYARERFVGEFRRVVALPDDADPSRIEATYRDGVLRILVPMLENRKARRIEVKAGSR